MNLRTFVIPVSLALVGFVGCSEQAAEPVPPEGDAAAQQAAPGGEGQAAAPAEKTAADICHTIVEAAKAKDIDTIIGTSIPGAADALADEAAKAAVLTSLAEATCGEPVIAADDPNKAMVMVTAGETSHEVPFVKGADGWRFDAATYIEKQAQKAAAADEGKGKNGKKAAKKGKKGKKAKKAKS